MKFGLFSTSYAVRPTRTTGTRTTSTESTKRWSRSSSPTSWASTTSGRPSTTSSRSTRTLPRPRSSSPPRAAHQEHPPRPRHRADAAEHNHPARVAERIATLDLVSDGRVEFGTGEGATMTEMGGFGAATARRRRKMWEEATREVRPHDDDDAVPRLRGHALQDAGAQRRAEAAAEAASAAVGRLQPARDGDGGRAPRHGRARRSASRRRKRPRSASTVLRAGPRRVLPDRQGDQPRALGVVSVLSCFDRDEEAIAKGQEGAAVLRLLAGVLLQPIHRRKPQTRQEEHLCRLHNAPEEHRWGPFGDAFRGFGGFGGGATRKSPRTRTRVPSGGGGPARRLHRHPEFIKDTLRKYEERTWT